MRLIDAPAMYPGVCARCGHADKSFGPYLDIDHEDKEGRRVVYCRTCVGQFVRVPGLDLAPKKDVLDALEEVRRLEDVERQVGEYANQAAASAKRVEKLEGELAGVRSENASLRNTIKMKEQDAAKVRLELLRSEIAESAKPKKKEKTAV